MENKFDWFGFLREKEGGFSWLGFAQCWCRVNSCTVSYTEGVGAIVSNRKEGVGGPKRHKKGKHNFAGWSVICFWWIQMKVTWMFWWVDPFPGGRGVGGWVGAMTGHCMRLYAWAGSSSFFWSGLQSVAHSSGCSLIVLCCLSLSGVQLCQWVAGSSDWNSPVNAQPKIRQERQAWFVWK